MTNVVVLMPWRTDNGEREALYKAVRRRVDALGYPVYLGDSSGPVFSISEAWNDAADKAGDWDIALQWGADFIIESPLSVFNAVKQAEQGDPYVKCFDAVTKLSIRQTQVFLRRGIYPLSNTEPPFGGPRAVRREVFDDVMGYDERFQGWGHEDRAFVHSMNVMGHESTSVPGRMVMLRHMGRAHLPNDPYYANQKKNLEILDEYQARTDPDSLQQYLREVRSTDDLHHAPPSALRTWIVGQGHTPEVR